MKTALVCGAGGFIGNPMVKRLKKEGYWVRGVDLKYPEFSPTLADDFIIADLRDQNVYPQIFDRFFDEIYQLAADMGGAGYVFTGEHDADILHNSAMINLNILHEGQKRGALGKIFYSSSACIYPEYNQMDTDNPNCSEESAYPAAPDSEYGWEKLFSERLYLAFSRNYSIPVRIARFHNVFGPEGTWRGGREKSPAALCRKVAEAAQGKTVEIMEHGSMHSLPYIEIWGDGKQTRSFLYIDECIEGVRRLMESDFVGPVNIGSDELISINDLLGMILGIAGISAVAINHIPGPLGVRGRNSHNQLIEQQLGWRPSDPLIKGITATYHWIESQVAANTLNP